jgi:hypothetical protein
VVYLGGSGDTDHNLFLFKKHRLHKDLVVIHGQKMAETFTKFQKYRQKCGPDQGPQMVLALTNFEKVAV